MTTVTHVSERLLPMSPVCTTFRAVGAGSPTFAAKPRGIIAHDQFEPKDLDRD